MIKSNGDFIRGCECCGKDDLVASQVVLTFNYGSCYDGEILTLELCGDCIDKIYRFIQNEAEGSLT